MNLSSGLDLKEGINYFFNSPLENGEKGRIFVLHSST